MTLSELVYRPFERLVRPLDLPIKPLPSSGPLAVVLHFAAMFKWVLAAVGAVSVISASLGLAVIWAIAFIVDGVTTQGAKAFLDNHFLFLAGFITLLAVFNPLFFFLQRALMSQTVAVGLPAAIRWQGHKAVERQDVAFFHDLFAGQVASRINQVTGSVQSQLVTGIDSIPRFAVQFIGSFALLTALAWPLAIPVLFWIIANAVTAWYAVPVYSQRSAEVAKINSRAVGAMTDIYGNIQMVKLFAAEDSEAGAIRKIIQDTVDIEHRQRRIFVSTDMLITMFNAALIVSSLIISMWGLVAGFVTIGQFVAALTIVRSLSASSRAFIGLGQSIARTMGTIRDAMPVLTTLPKIANRPDARPLKVTKGAIRYDRVDFEYSQGHTVIRDLSLSIRPGEKVGLVGISGAGKSTLVHLLLRLYDVDGGAIRIDGQDVRDVTQESLRANIGVISQEVSLLHRSIRDNIRYGRPNASDKEIVAAAKLAKAHEFIADLRDGEGRVGYDAFVGDRGVRLSGGQRQRVAIARVLLKNAPILILDEATSSLDSEAEAAIQEKLQELMTGKTVLCIAHRLSTIAALDRIVVLDRGRIVEAGTPDTLLASGGLYARLWKLQTGGYIPDTLQETES